MIAGPYNDKDKEQTDRGGEPAAYLVRTARARAATTLVESVLGPDAGPWLVLQPWDWSPVRVRQRVHREQRRSGRHAPLNGT
jgi:hypothetical protein